MNDQVLQQWQSEQVELIQLEDKQLVHLALLDFIVHLYQLLQLYAQVDTGLMEEILPDL